MNLKKKKKKARTESNDVLSMALGTPEHWGKVRGVGSDVTANCTLVNPFSLKGWLCLILHGLMI